MELGARYASAGWYARRKLIFCIWRAGVAVLRWMMSDGQTISDVSRRYEWLPTVHSWLVNLFPGQAKLRPRLDFAVLKEGG
jgi:hypothetical protein